MKKTILKTVLVAFMATTSLISCSTDPITSNAPSNENANAIVSKPPPIGLPEFYYRENGVLTYSTVTDPYANTTNLIIYGVNGGFPTIKIPLTSLAVGTYNIDGFNNFYYSKPFFPNVWYAKSGYIKITANSYGMISGSFKVSGTGISGVTSVNGYFNSIPALP